MRPSELIGLFFIAAASFLVAGAISASLAAAGTGGWSRWAALHLVFLGGVSQLVIGASQFFVAAALATDPPARTVVRAQFALWNLGVILLVLGVAGSVKPVVVLGAGLLLAGLAAYLAGLVSMRHSSLQRRPMATAWYFIAAGFLAAGIVSGAALALGLHWSQGSLLAAHLTLNLGGWFGAAILGTLHTFYPSLTRTTLAFPRCERPALSCWSIGVAALAVGFAFGIEPSVIGGLALSLAAACLVGVNLVASLIRAPRPLTVPALVIGPAQGFLIAGIAIALVAALAGDAASIYFGETRPVLSVMVLAGWLGLTVPASLAHLSRVALHARRIARSTPR